MSKPIGPLCNLDCKYCFYLEKQALFAAGDKYPMPENVLSAFIAGYISQPAPVVEFVWQGGEPTLLGIDFFRRVVELQKPFAKGKTKAGYRAVTMRGTGSDGRRYYASWGIVLGDKSLGELIGMMKKGIIVGGAMGAHSGNILNGDYSLGLAPGIYVENGVRAMGQIHVDEAFDLKIGMTMHPTWAPVRVQYGENVYGLVLEPAK